jgi:hypothetical protein
VAAVVLLHELNLGDEGVDPYAIFVSISEAVGQFHLPAEDVIFDEYPGFLEGQIAGRLLEKWLCRRTHGLIPLPRGHDETDSRAHRNLLYRYQRKNWDDVADAVQILGPAAPFSVSQTRLVYSGRESDTAGRDTDLNFMKP